MISKDLRDLPLHGHRTIPSRGAGPQRSQLQVRSLGLPSVAIDLAARVVPGHGAAPYQVRLSTLATTWLSDPILAQF